MEQEDERGGWTVPVPLSALREIQDDDDEIDGSGGGGGSSGDHAGKSSNKLGGTNDHGSDDDGTGGAAENGNGPTRGGNGACVCAGVRSTKYGGRECGDGQLLGR